MFDFPRDLCFTSEMCLYCMLQSVIEISDKPDSEEPKPAFKVCRPLLSIVEYQVVFINIKLSPLFSYLYFICLL